MKITKIPGLGRFGHFIDDVDLNTISDEEWMEIGNLHLQGLVTIIRGNTLDYPRYNELMLKWGTPRFPRPVNLYLKYGKPLKELIFNNELNAEEMESVQNARRWLIDKHMQLVRVTPKKNRRGQSIGIFGDGELNWHSNACSDVSFAPGVSLMGWENFVGSATGFCTTTDYYESLSESFRSELDEMVVVHNYHEKGVHPEVEPDQEAFYKENQCPEPDMKVPLVITSPGGVKGIHLGITTLDYIEGMSREESTKIFETIKKGIFVPEYMYDHWYKGDRDLMIFDNSITLHRRLIEPAKGRLPDRVGLRLQFDYDKLAGEYLPFAQDEYNQERKHRVDLFPIATADIEVM